MSQWLKTCKVKGDYIPAKEAAGNIHRNLNYFIFSGDKKGDGTPIIDSDSENIELFKLNTGLLLSENQMEQVLNEIDKDPNADKDKNNIVVKKYNELRSLNEECARYFLKYLHKMLWKVPDNQVYDRNTGNFLNTALISSIPINKGLEVILPLIEQIGYINEYILNLKYNPKIVSADVSHKLDELKNKVQFNLNPTKKSKK